jgi:hypothetical protein
MNGPNHLMDPDEMDPFLSELTGLAPHQEMLKILFSLF